MLLKAELAATFVLSRYWNISIAISIAVIIIVSLVQRSLQQLLRTSNLRAVQQKKIADEHAQLCCERL